MGFKVGDIITIKDNPEDEAFKKNTKGYYRVENTYKEGYDLYSLKNKILHKHENLKEFHAEMVKDYEKLSTESKLSFPCHLGQYKTVKQAFDDSYRLAKKEELVLYGNSTNSENN